MCANKWKPGRLLVSGVTQNVASGEGGARVDGVVHPPGNMGQSRLIAAADLSDLRGMTGTRKGGSMEKRSQQFLALPAFQVCCWRQPTRLLPRRRWRIPGLRHASLE